MLKELKQCLESEKEDKTIFDIIIFGSFVKGKDKPRDIDILIIFLEGSLKERLDKLQNIKLKLGPILKEISKETLLDVKQIMLKEIFSPSFFAKTGVFLEGISIFNNKRFSEIIGFHPFSLFWYSLKDLSHSQKIKFNYILAGRGKKGIIEELKGRRIANGAILVPIENSAIFEDILMANKISNYHKKNILEEI